MEQFDLLQIFQRRVWSLLVGCLIQRGHDLNAGGQCLGSRERVGVAPAFSVGSALGPSEIDPDDVHLVDTSRHHITQNPLQQSKSMIQLLHCCIVLCSILVCFLVSTLLLFVFGSFLLAKTLQ